MWRLSDECHNPGKSPKRARKEKGMHMNFCSYKSRLTLFLLLTSPTWITTQNTQGFLSSLSPVSLSKSLHLPVLVFSIYKLIWFPQKIPFKSILLRQNLSNIIPKTPLWKKKKTKRVPELTVINISPLYLLLCISVIGFFLNARFVTPMGTRQNVEQSSVTALQVINCRNSCEITEQLG